MSGLLLLMHSSASKVRSSVSVNKCSSLLVRSIAIEVRLSVQVHYGGVGLMCA
jgi:hypothetical protein